MPNPSLMALQQLRKLVSDLKGQETLESNFAIQPRAWKIENQRGNLVGTCFFLMRFGLLTVVIEGQQHAAFTFSMETIYNAGGYFSFVIMRERGPFNCFIGV